MQDTCTGVLDSATVSKKNKMPSSGSDIITYVHRKNKGCPEVSILEIQKKKTHSITKAVNQSTNQSARHSVKFQQ